MPVTINGTTGIVSPNYVGNGSVPVGSVYHFATSTAPTGFLICNDDVVPNGNGTVQGVTTDFSALYSILGTAYGAAGTLPDLRGIFVRGSGDQTISGTVYSGTFAAKQQDAFKAHTHTVAGSSNTGLVGGGGSAGLATTNTTSSTGGTETRPANIALLPCIKY